jgi:fructose-bisphosphate aldolase class I
MPNRLESIARALVSPGKGILAADESLPTIQKRFNALKIESTEETRRSYREMLFTTSGIEEFISGVILFDETIRQKAGNGKSLVEVLTRKGIIPGIKVDKGTIAMPGFPNEKITAGRDGLRERLNEYVKLGAQFAKWRAVITIGPSIPTLACMQANARDLALYASLSQEAGLVPIVEPEVLMDGDHDIDRCEEVTLATLAAVFDALREYRVMFEGMLLKPNMIVSGKQAAKQATPSEVAERTIRTLRNAVPAAVPGIVFLSGGQTPEQATEHLNIMNAHGPHPWEVSFSFGRALQDPALRTWNGSAENIGAAQHQLYHRAKCNGAARYGTYTALMDQLAA